MKICVILKIRSLTRRGVVISSMWYTQPSTCILHCTHLPCICIGHAMYLLTSKSATNVILVRVQLRSRQLANTKRTAKNENNHSEKQQQEQRHIVLVYVRMYSRLASTSTRILPPYYARRQIYTNIYSYTYCAYVPTMYIRTRIV